MTNSTISMTNLSRTFGERYALRQVQLDIRDGEGILLTGPNGSGKTTLLRIMATLLSPSSGEFFLLGKTFQQARFELRPIIGALFMNGFLHDDLTVDENLVFYARLYDLHSPRQTITERLQEIGMLRFRHEQVRHLSRGERQKIALIRAMLHSPKILLLDEPTTGLDHAANEFLLGRLKKLKGSVTIVCATHQPELFSNLADRELNLHEGRIG